ncbi:MAG: DNA replication and repair protein RecF [Sphingobacteriia bacterium]|nr:DNA replication and repair protein RecF [Sphingobacteriia bacterium]NCC38696.1 DNA replication and repair protein RecF [Gammaproteobacteria bacterium]
MIDRPSGPRLVSLRVMNLRNLREMSLAVEPETMEIQISGSNGAGKTTLLESIYLLARGRTFRGRKAGPLTTRGESRTLVEGRFIEGEHNTDLAMTFERRGNWSARHINGVPWTQIGPRDQPLRVKLIGENPQAILEGEPSLRRGLLDWNVFHVEPSLAQLRSDLRRVILQRNASLRANRPDPSPWDPALVELSNRLTRSRCAFFDPWRRQFLDIAREFPFLADCDLVFDQGWDQTSDLVDLLARSRVSEIQRGQSLVGAHRADLRLRRHQAPAHLSRGQAKVAVCLLQIAAEQVHLDAGLSPSLWLIDDLDAELDEDVRALLGHRLAAIPAQRITSQPKGRGAQSFDELTDGYAMFHVEPTGVRRITRDPIASSRI